MSRRGSGLARVCSYDRARDVGVTSDLTRAFRQIVYELHTLLTRAGERADDPKRMLPDGRVVRSSSLATGDAIPAVKISGPLRLEDIPPQALAQIRAGLSDASQHANDPPRDKLPANAQRMRAWALGRVGHVLAAVNPFENEGLAALRSRGQAKLHALDSLSLIVITRGRSDETGSDAQALEQQHRQELAAVAARSTRGRNIIAANSGHHAQLDEPELVISAIRDIVTLVRK